MNNIYEFYVYYSCYIFRHKKGWVTIVTHPNKQTRLKI